MVQTWEYGPADPGLLGGAVGGGWGPGLGLPKQHSNSAMTGGKNDFTGQVAAAGGGARSGGFATSPSSRVKCVWDYRVGSLAQLDSPPCSPPYLRGESPIITRWWCLRTGNLSWTSKRLLRYTSLHLGFLCFSLEGPLSSFHGYTVFVPFISHS